MRTKTAVLGPRVLFVSDGEEEIELLVTFYLDAPTLADNPEDEDDLEYTAHANIDCDWFSTRVRAIAEDDVQLIARLIWLAGISINQSCLDMSLRCRSFVQKALNRYGDMESSLFT